MPVSYSMPPWVGQPADPAAHYQAGFQMGTHLGAQQAAQMFQQQQMARELQKDEFERQSQSLAMQMKVEEASRAHRANFAYQRMIGAGVDPMEALKSVGPDMGYDPTQIIAMQERRQERAAQQANLAEYHRGLLQQRAEDRAQRAEQAQAALESREKIVAGKDTFESKIDTLAKLQTAAEAAKDSGDQELYQEMRAKLDAARAFTPGGRAMGESAEPVVKEVGGVKIAYVPGSKNIHIIPNEPSKKAFLSKAIPLLIRDGQTPEKAVETLGKAFELMNPAEKTAAPPTAPGKATSKFIPGKIYVDADGHKAMYQQDGTWKEIE